MFKGPRQRAVSLVLVLLLAQILAFTSPQSVSGEISSCFVDIGTHQVRLDDSTNIDFEITNESGSSAAYIYIGRPAPQVVIESVSVDTWSVGGGEDFLELTGGTIGAGETVTFTITINMLDQAEATGN